MEPQCLSSCNVVVFFSIFHLQCSNGKVKQIKMTVCLIIFRGVYYFLSCIITFIEISKGEGGSPHYL